MSTASGHNGRVAYASYPKNGEAKALLVPARDKPHEGDQAILPTDRTERDPSG